MSEHPVRDATSPDSHGWRAGTVRVFANALLVLLAFEAVSLGFAAAAIVAGMTLPVTPVELVPLLTVYVVARWIFVLPALVPVLAGIEYVARRVPHARVLTAIVALAPMVLWELTKSPGDFPSERGAILGVTAVLFAVIARLPARFRARAPDNRAAAEPPVGTAVAPR